MKNKIVPIGIGVVILLVIIIALSSKSKDDAAREAALLEAQKLEQARLQQQQVQVTPEPQVVLSLHEQQQLSLQQAFGIPPEGFEWNMMGELVAIGNDVWSHEDVIYTFIRSLSILDFATAQKCASVSYCISTYNNYYNSATASITNYYNSFLRKQYKYALTTLEVNEIKDVAVFADGTYIVTLNVDVVDLTDKDFWLSDKDSLFSEMRTYTETENDSVKSEQVVYDYIMDAYENNKIGKRSVDIEIVVQKKHGGGYLISDDSELNNIIGYESGVDVARYIIGEFNTWLFDTQMSEQWG